MTNNPKRLEVLGMHVTVACSFWSRMRGLLGRRSLAANEGLLLVPCTNIHTVGMNFSIDVVFLNKDGEVVAVVPQIKPWRVAAAWRAHACLELPSGGADRVGLRVGQRIAHLSASSLRAR